MSEIAYQFFSFLGTWYSLYLFFFFLTKWLAQSLEQVGWLDWTLVDNSHGTDTSNVRSEKNNNNEYIQTSQPESWMSK